MMKIGTSSCCGPPFGQLAVIPTGGVSNMNVFAAASASPVTLFVPAGMVTVNVVACGNRISGSNRIVRVPIHRQRPFGVGESVTG